MTRFLHEILLAAPELNTEDVRNDTHVKIECVQDTRFLCTLYDIFISFILEGKKEENWYDIEICHFR